MTDRVERISFAGTITADGRRLKGSVSMAGRQTPRNGEYVEVDPNVLARADRSAAVLVVGHQAFSEGGYDPLRTVARVDNGSLRITPTAEGFEYETDELPNTTYANDALELARTGVFGGTSFDIFGLRSQVRVEPGNKRVRRYSSIAEMGAVTPVVEPAFPSTVAAFSKESDVTEVIDQPEAPAPPPEKPPVTFTAPRDDKSDLYRRAEAFARDQSLDQLAEQMGNIVALGADMSPAEQDRYDAFSAVYEDRKKTERDARDRFERIRIADEMRRGVRVKTPEGGLFASDDYTQAFSRYMRSGDKQIMAQFAQTISGDGTQGGFTVPDGFIAKLTERLKAYGGIATVSDEITTSTGESLRWGYIDDTANKAVVVAEDTQAASGADLVFDAVELGAFEYDATGASGNPIEVSLPLLQDSAFDLEGRLTDLLGIRIGRKQADHFATGAGGTEPVGLLTKAADVMTATAVSLAAPEHIFQLDAEYRNGGNARWVMSDTSLVKIWTAQATTNEPLFQPGGTLDGTPFGRLFGYPITIDNSAGNLVAFGDIKKAYIIRRVKGVQLLVDPYTAQKRRAIQYHAWARADGNIQDPNAYSVSSWVGVSADT